MERNLNQTVLKKCKACSILFEPIKSIQPYCFNCTIERAKKHVKKQRDKKERAEKKELKEKLKTVSDYRTEARYWFQRWIRIRDLGTGCISCGVLLTDIRDYHAGHMYQANNYPQLLFNEHAVNGQCIFCNKHKSGNEHEYRKGIVNRYGIEVLFSLEKLADDKTLRTLNKDYYIDVANDYKKRCKELEK